MLVPLLADLAARVGYRLFLLGAAPGVAEAAGQALQARAIPASRSPGLCRVARPGGGGGD